MNHDWRGEMARIYAFLGLDLTSDVLARMRNWLGGATRHAGHRYRLAQFGLDATGLATA